MHVAPAEASRVAVFAVDEGILQVARYKNPDPLAYFFQKRMLQVETTQILDLILPEFRRFLALAAPGGDADGGFARHLNPFNRKRKPPVAWWSGIIDAGPGGRELRYAVPDYFNGRLRIVAIAVNSRRAGVTEALTEVKGDFILTPNVPAMVAPGDEFSVTVGVFNNISGKDPIHVQVQASRELTLTSASNSDLQIAEKREGVAEFRFKANAVLGPASLKFTAIRGRSEAHIEESVSVRPAIAYRTQLTLGRFDGAERHRASQARSLPRAPVGGSLRFRAPAGLGRRSGRLSRFVSLSLHRTTGQQGIRCAAARLPAGVRRGQDARPAADRGNACHVAEPRERFGRLRALVVIAARPPISPPCTQPTSCWKRATAVKRSRPRCWPVSTNGSRGSPPRRLPL